MTKSQHLDILMLLSALESWSFAQGKPIPDYLLERLNDLVEILSKEVLS